MLSLSVNMLLTSAILMHMHSLRETALVAGLVWHATLLYIFCMQAASIWVPGTSTPGGGGCPWRLQVRLHACAFCCA